MTPKILLIGAKTGVFYIFIFQHIVRRFYTVQNYKIHGLSLPGLKRTTEKYIYSPRSQLVSYIVKQLNKNIEVTVKIVKLVLPTVIKISDEFSQHHTNIYHVRVTKQKIPQHTSYISTRVNLTLYSTDTKCNSSTVRLISISCCSMTLCRSLVLFSPVLWFWVWSCFRIQCAWHGSMAAWQHGSMELANILMLRCIVSLTLLPPTESWYLVCGHRADGSRISADAACAGCRWV